MNLIRLTAALAIQIGLQEQRFIDYKNVCIYGLKKCCSRSIFTTIFCISLAVCHRFVDIVAILCQSQRKKHYSSEIIINQFPKKMKNTLTNRRVVCSKYILFIRQYLQRKVTSTYFKYVKYFYRKMFKSAKRCHKIVCFIIFSSKF